MTPNQLRGRLGGLAVGHADVELDRVAARLNGRPRKTLDWATPAEALNALLSQAA